MQTSGVRLRETRVQEKEACHGAENLSDHQNHHWHRSALLPEQPKRSLDIHMRNAGKGKRSISADTQEITPLSARRFVVIHSASEAMALIAQHEELMIPALMIRFGSDEGQRGSIRVIVSALGIHRIAA